MKGNLFADTFRDLSNASYVLTTNSGISAYLVGLLALNLPVGGEIILPALAWAQLLSPLSLLKLQPVFADCDSNGLILKSEVERHINARTVAVVLCHLFGNPSEAKAVSLMCKLRGIALIEDCSQSLFASESGEHVGSRADFSFASVGRGKLLSCGEGGLLWTNNLEVYDKASMLVGHAEDATTSQEEQLLLVTSLSLRMHPQAIEEGSLKLPFYLGLSEEKSAKCEELKFRLRSSGIESPRALPTASPRWSHLPLFPNEFKEVPACISWSKGVPASVLSDKGVPLAIQFGVKVRFAEIH